VERRARTRRKTSARSVKRQPARKPAASTPWPEIESFLDTEEGSISLGSIGTASIGYAAVVSDEHNMLVALVRQPNETLHQLLNRLESALRPAIEDQTFIDEINGSPPTQ
jgi:hypothetical protein